MKHLTLTIPVNLKRDAADVLHNIDLIKSFTLIDVEEHSAQSENDPFLSSRDKVVGYTPHTRIELLLEDNHVHLIIEELRKSKLSASKHINYWVTDIRDYRALNISDKKSDNDQI